MPVLVTAAFSSRLRQELRLRNLEYAKRLGVPFQLSYGSAPVVVYEPDDRQHGNFLPETYAAILSEPSWAKRLAKVHTSGRASLPRSDRKWCELDSSNSSDALLMNIFCCPGVFEDGRLTSLLGVEPGFEAEFGVKARVPLVGGKFDRTEVDMRIGSLLVEAKLTEADFQSAPKSRMEDYRDFAEVFERRALPQDKKSYGAYQLLRNVLAAYAMQSSFCVMLDARRPDLLEAWYSIMSCVKLGDLRRRCQVITWQELSEALPERLREFLAEKYGIQPGPIMPFEILPSENDPDFA